MKANEAPEKLYFGIDDKGMQAVAIYHAKETIKKYKERKEK